jgi:hypothetical protein
MSDIIEDYQSDELDYEDECYGYTLEELEEELDSDCRLCDAQCGKEGDLDSGSFQSILDYIYDDMEDNTEEERITKLEDTIVAHFKQVL